MVRMLELSKRLYLCPSNKLRGFEAGKIGPFDGMVTMLEVTIFHAVNFNATLP